MFSNKYRCIYIEIPKTGSTSIRSLVGNPILPHQDILYYKNMLRNQWPYEHKGHLQVKKYYQSLTTEGARRKIGDAVFDRYFKFSFVRNPWARVVSLYFRNDGEQMRDKMSFEEFVDWIQCSSDTSVFISGKKNQRDWFLDENGQEILDFVGKFETLQSDWNIIASKIGAPKELPHLNEGIDKLPYTDYYTAKTQDIISAKFKTDIERFEYTFGQ
ncbi:MAG TPA: hypothetical protein DCX14_11235 [Flavobacteriales bacterium]|jgi:hypothetical protein|nr:sulfotransferase family 2 domain-containing protein [Flavobacteriales bacterium]HAW20747.1 hypothetical protein [Flavobacteriales bacterium]